MFCYRRIRTLVANLKETCSFHRLIMGKVEISTLSELGYMDVLQNCLLSSPLYSI